MELKKSIHLYNFTSKHLASIRVLLIKNKLPMCKIIGANMGDIKISEILNGKLQEVESNLPKDEMVVLLGGLNHSEINRIVSAIKKEIKGKKPLFAVVTEDNYNWAFKDLIKELCKERDYFNNHGKPMEDQHKGV